MGWERKMEEAKNRLYVGNLPYNTTNDELSAYFAQVGEVAEAIVITEKTSGRSKGFGFVTMADEQLANKAQEELDGKDFNGRTLKVNIARPMKSQE